MEWFHESGTLAVTAALGRRLGELLFPGAVVALIGPMGAGKTTLTQSIASGLGAEPRQVTSPTFALVHEYEGRVPLYHFDTYRLNDVKAFIDLGVSEYFQSAGVCVVEWADRVETALPEEHLRVTIEPIGEDQRRFKFESRGIGYEELVQRLAATR
jgi:tRNA threonylcarbamoyladenosine biosynthesis protein TsaE